MKLSGLAFRSCSILLLVLLSFSSYSQLHLQLGEQFLAGKEIVKVKVTPEDHTVWALSKDGKVYYKKDTDIDFQLYPLTAGSVVSGLTGFNADEMYFLIAPAKVLYIKSGVVNEIALPFAGVSKVNSIGAVNVFLKDPYAASNPFLSDVDWVAIATNIDMYKLERGENSINSTYPYSNLPYYPERDWEISNDGYKSVDFRFKHPAVARCYYDSYHITLNTSYTTVYESVIPELAPYPEKINCTLFAQQLFDGYRYGYFNGIFNFWGTDEGLYVKQFGCSGQIKKVIDNQVINDLEEIYALTSIFKQNYVLAATNTGVQYTEASIFPEQDLSFGGTVEKIEFKPLANFPVEKVYSLCADSKLLEVLNRGGVLYKSVCERIIWVASENGLRKLYVSFDQDYFEQLQIATFSYSINPISTTANTSNFKKCNAEKLTIDLRIPETFSNQLLIQWYKNGVEQTVMLGKLKADLMEEGRYQIKLTALCEGITISSKEIVLENVPAATSVLNYPAVIDLCKGNTFLLSTPTTSGYSYRWYKDGLLIPNANSASYTASQTGSYFLEASNCSGTYVASNSVRLNFQSIDQPVISSLKHVYCENEPANLSINLPADQEASWYLDGNELESMRDRAEVPVEQELIL